MKNQSLRHITYAAVIAALYAAISLTTSFLLPSGGAFQVRLSEAMTILPYFSLAAVPGLTIGCLIVNIIMGANIFDIIFGSLATFIGALGTYLLRKHKFLAPLPPILANTLILPFVIRFAYGTPGTIPYFMLTIGVTELISCGVIGLILLFALERLGFSQQSGLLPNRIGKK